MQATPALTPPPTAQTPTAVTVVQTAPVTSGIPMTVADIEGLRAKRSELSSQLESAAGRRASLSRQLRGKDGADRAGIEARIAVLDKRIMQLESDISETGRLMTLAPNALVASTEPSAPFGRMDPDATAAVSSVFIIFVLAPMAFAATRMMWKRSNRPPPQNFTGDAAKRLERLEQGVDAIALEVERISEGQRFVTRLLSETHGTPALPAAQRIAAPEERGRPVHG